MLYSPFQSSELDYHSPEFRWQSHRGPGHGTSLLQFWEPGDQKLFLYQSEEDAKFNVGTIQQANLTGAFVWNNVK